MQRELQRCMQTAIPHAVGLSSKHNGERERRLGVRSAHPASAAYALHDLSELLDNAELQSSHM